MDEKRNSNVLIVDDEKTVRDFLTRLVSLRGLTVKSAESGFMAIEMMACEAFDFVFLDVRMPKMDGIQTLRALKKINAGAKYVMMTGYSVENLLEEAQKENIFASIKKPFDIKLISTFLNEQAKEKRDNKISIMVIDDAPEILDFFKRLLKDDIYEVNVFSSTDLALGELKKRDFDLIFLDIFLGDANGLEFYSEIRNIRPNAQIVFITGYFEKIKDDINKLDVRGCLMKPFEIDKIFSEIDKIKNIVKK